MQTSLKKLIKKAFNLVGLEIVNLNAFTNYQKVQALKLNENTELKYALDRLTFIVRNIRYKKSNNLDSYDFFKYAIDKLIVSKSQLFQDLFVLYCLNNKKNGFFIEFGAADGIVYSNSFLLENEYQWNGILAEPAVIWNTKLKENRNCFIDNRCVWSKSGEVLNFNETSIAEYSTVDIFTNSDSNYGSRKNKQTYKVKSITLNDLLKEHNAPFDIDYLSIDTEGSEFNILDAFDFSRYKIKIITVEHNYTPNRESVFKLLTEKGYTRVFTSISLFDDWYVMDSINDVLKNR
ncbi:FkbM family methyltransferase [Ginsengibacter hankyongi]|uniref:FkbM family methyltransferase n=1 Tax=Ginsengibacter hankyongi TaxID=2607284 RepID=A0A5J5ICQ3_9BACT|nr:FkbM family methyltransferase [Ginsengibacter hankyongi]